MVKKKVKKSVSRASAPKKGVSRKKPVKIKRSRMPALVRVIAILYFIFSFFSIVAGLIFIVAGAMGGEASQMISDALLEGSELAEGADQWLASAIVSSIVLGGVLLIIIGGIDIVVGIGLWGGMNWARIVIIVFMAIGFVFAIVDLDIFGIVVTGLMGGYLAFSKKVRATFK